MLGDLAVEAVGPAAVHVGAARVGGDGEPGRHRQPQHRGHLGQVGALAAEEVLHLHRGLAVLVIEAEDEGHEVRAYSARLPHAVEASITQGDSGAVHTDSPRTVASSGPADSVGRRRGVARFAQIAHATTWRAPDGTLRRRRPRAGCSSTTRRRPRPRFIGPVRATTASSTGGTFGGRCWRGLGGREQPSLPRTIRVSGPQCNDRPPDLDDLSSMSRRARRDQSSRPGGCRADRRSGPAPGPSSRGRGR